MVVSYYIKNGCSTKHPLKDGCLVYQEAVVFFPCSIFHKAPWAFRAQVFALAAEARFNGAARHGGSSMWKTNENQVFLQ